MSNKSFLDVHTSDNKNVDNSLCKQSHKVIRRSLTERGDGVVDLEGVHHISIHQTRSVNKRHQAELLLFGGGDLSAQVIRHTYNITTNMYKSALPEEI